MFFGALIGSLLTKLFPSTGVIVVSGVGAVILLAFGLGRIHEHKKKVE
jgi:hypothetical protein